ncbi:hypothetical protein M9H77_36121 [Catharanthus roseus]|uniref:Uncharacterized protein n=1 Tax=Catharanthus roseus TaxID=4058 RepID=A0ACB9ZS78_CATRO|nr:hypothetical protein M9H77_36121 [Catharanthus roseus]
MGTGITHHQDEACIGGQGTAMLNELQLMATVAGGFSRSRLFGYGSEVAHLKAESNRALTGLPPCYLEEQRIMRRIEAAVSSVCGAFNKHMRQFAEQNYMRYTTMPLMMDLVRATMVVVPSTTSSSTIVVAGTLEARVSSSTPFLPSIDAPATTVDPLPSQPSCDIRGPKC